MKNKFRNLKKVLGIIIFLFLLTLIFSKESNAASASISVSSTGTVGTAMTISVTGTGVQWNLALKVDGTTIASSSELENYAANENISFSGTYTPTSAGTVTVTLEGSVTEYSDGSTIRNFDSKSITISEAASTTTDNTDTSDDTSNTDDTTDNSDTTNNSDDTSNSETTTTVTVSSPVLSNLGINPYDFTGFRSGTTSYSVTVPNDCTSVTIYATTNSTGATISGTGTVTLKEGTNKYTVTVSNSAGSKSYTISIVRQSEENEIIANSSDEETDENEETSSGIGLDSLTITGYQLNEEFDINTYEYTVTLSEEITEELLEEIKEKISYTVNSENVNIEYEIEASEDGTSGIITLIVKDDEKEYSRYSITFLNSVVEEEKKEEEKTIAIAGTTSNNDSGSTGGSSSLDGNKKNIGYIICICLLAGVGIYFAIRTYIKERKLVKTEDFETDENDEEKENIVESILMARENEFPKLESEMPENMEALMDDIESLEPEEEENDTDLNLEKTKSEDLVKDTKEKLSELSGYRKLRKGFSSRKTLKIFKKTLDS